MGNISQDTINLDGNIAGQRTRRDEDVWVKFLIVSKSKAEL